MDYTNDFLIHKRIVYVFVFVCFIHFVASHFNITHIRLKKKNTTRNKFLFCLVILYVSVHLHLSLNIIYKYEQDGK